MLIILKLENLYHLYLQPVPVFFKNILSNCPVATTSLLAVVIFVTFREFIFNEDSIKSPVTIWFEKYRAWKIVIKTQENFILSRYKMH